MCVIAPFIGEFLITCCCWQIVGQLLAGFGWLLEGY